MDLDFFTDYQNLIACIDNMTKDAQGYGYKYVELTPLLEEVLPKIHENNFILVQTIKQAEGVYSRETTGSKGNVRISTPAFVLHSELIHKSGKVINCDMPLYVDDIDPQAMGSAETYMRRYSIYALLQIKTVDDDGATSSARAKENEPKTFEDFAKAIYKAVSVKQLSAMWYKYKELFAQDSEEYKALNKLSGNKKLAIQNPTLTTDIFHGVPEVVKRMVGVE